MKLYTEEQVKELIAQLQKATLPENRECDGAFCMGCWKDVVRETLKSMTNLTPIELPSDDEIKEKVELILSYNKNREEEETVSAGFALGAYWVLNHIKQQDIYWRTDKPPKVGQYIVNIGANGISWGWWDGNNWKKLWHEYQIDVSGWLPTPLHKQQDNE